jgi:hypothetical protein
MKPLIMQFSPTFCHFIPLRCEYSSQQCSSNTMSLCFSLTVRAQVSHPYRTIDKIIILHILIFIQQKRRQNVLDWFSIAGNCLIWTECYKAEIMYRFCYKWSSFLWILWKVNRVYAYWEIVHRSAYFVR